MGTLATPVQPLPAARRPTHIEKHGDVRADEFFWLCAQENPALLAYLEAEDAYTETVTAHTCDLQTRIYDEMRTRTRKTDRPAPLPAGADFYEPDGSFFLGVTKTRSRQFVLIRLESNTAHEVWFLPADMPAAALRRVEPRAPGHVYAVDHRGDHFYIRSNAGAVNFHILTEYAFFLDTLGAYV